MALCQKYQNNDIISIFPLRTPLHWACKKGYLDVAALLLKNGADKNIRSEIGETPAFLCINPQILQLLDMPLVMPTDSQRVLNESAVHNVMPKYVKSDYVHGATDSGIPRVRNNGLYQDGEKFVIILFFVILMFVHI